MDPYAALVRAAAGGDRAAAGALVRALLPRVRNLVRYLVYRDAEVDDLAQDALIAVLGGLGTFRGEGSFAAWTDRVVVRSTFAGIRKRRADQAATTPHDEDMPDEASVGGDEFLARREAVRALDRLPPEQRGVIVMHHVLEMTVPEIADELRVSPETVRSRLRLGKARLRPRDQDGHTTSEEMLP